jgi:integrase
MAVKLSRKVAKEAAAPSITWDSETKGLALRVFGGGTRTFVLKYRIDGRERQYKIGNFPTWSVDAARTEAKELRKLIDQGRDPAGEKRERREAPTIQDLVDRYCREHLPQKRSKLRGLDYMAKRAQYRETAELKTLNEIATRLGQHTKVADVHGGDIQAMHRGFTKDHGPVLANRALGFCSRMFALSLMPVAGENRPWRNAEQGNPCRGIPRNREEPRERFFSAEEMTRIAAALDAYGADARSDSSVDCIKLIAISGCRPQEARLARWEGFAEIGFWTRPSSHMKTNKTLRLPLSPPAIELIERLRKRRKPGQEWVFPGQRKGQPLQTVEHLWKFVRQHAGLGKDARVYTLRHSFASIGAGAGMSLSIIGKLLGHVNHATTARYAHLSTDPLREATTRIGAVIDAANGNGGGEVVRIGKVRP